MDSRADTHLLEVVHQSVPVCGTNYVEVIDGAGPRRLLRQDHDRLRSQEEAFVLSSAFAPVSIPLRQVGQLRMKNASLYCVEPSVVTFHVVIVLLGLSVISQHLDSVRVCLVVCSDRPTFAARAKI